jgi:hypothetical protein
MIATVIRIREREIIGSTKAPRRNAAGRFLVTLAWQVERGKVEVEVGCNFAVAFARFLVCGFAAALAIPNLGPCLVRVAAKTAVALRA